MADEKMIRLGQASRKLNVGHNTILEFLSKKGFSVDNNPNAKLTKVVEKDGKRVETTVGRVLLNEQLPKQMPFVNGLLKKKGLQQLVQKCYLDFGLERTVEMLDALKNLGFTYATRSGLSIGIDDLVIPQEKGPLVEGARDDGPGIARRAAHDTDRVVVAHPDLAVRQDGVEEDGNRRAGDGHGDVAVDDGGHAAVGVAIDGRLREREGGHAARDAVEAGLRTFDDIARGVGFSDAGRMRGNEDLLTLAVADRGASARHGLREKAR